MGQNRREHGAAAKDDERAAWLPVQGLGCAPRRDRADEALPREGHRPLREPKERGVFRQERQERRHWLGRSAGLRRRDEAANQGGTTGTSSTRASRLSAAAPPSRAAAWPPSGS